MRLLPGRESGYRQRLFKLSRRKSPGRKCSKHTDQQARGTPTRAYNKASQEAALARLRSTHRRTDGQHQPASQQAECSRQPEADHSDHSQAPSRFSPSQTSPIASVASPLLQSGKQSTGPVSAPADDCLPSLSVATESSLPAVAAQEMAASQAITLGQQFPAAASSKPVADQPADSAAAPVRRALPEAPGTMLLPADTTLDASAFACRNGRVVNLL